LRSILKDIKTMKKYLIIPLALFAAILFLNFNTTGKVQTYTSVTSPGLTIPDDVQKIIDNHCYDCHNANSESEKGKKKLDFDKLLKLKKSKQAGKLSKIADVVKEDEMPPAKIIEKYPEMALSAEQKTTITKWAEDAANSLFN